MWFWMKSVETSGERLPLGHRIWTDVGYAVRSEEPCPRYFSVAIIKHTTHKSNLREKEFILTYSYKGNTDHCGG